MIHTAAWSWSGSNSIDWQIEVVCTCGETFSETNSDLPYKFADHLAEANRQEEE